MWNMLGNVITCISQKKNSQALFKTAMLSRPRDARSRVEITTVRRSTAIPTYGGKGKTLFDCRLSLRTS